jgi:hypothetical protein
MREWLVLVTEHAVLWIDARALVVIVAATVQAVIGMEQSPIMGGDPVPGAPRSPSPNKPAPHSNVH